MNRGARLIVGLACALWLVACSSGAKPVMPASSSQSWSCIEALHRVELTAGSTAAEAKRALDQLVADPAISSDERAYYASLRSALVDVADSAAVGTSLDKVECPLASSAGPHT